MKMHAYAVTAACLLLLLPALNYASSRPHAPTIVAQVQLKNQTALLTGFNIFTPTSDGTYRISSYTEIVSPGLPDVSFCGTLHWTDDAFPQSTAFITRPPDGSLCLDTNATQGGEPPSENVYTIRALANTPVTVDTTLSGSTNNLAYDMFVTVERLQ